MILEISIDEPVMPDWIWEQNRDGASLLQVWFVRAQCHKEILEAEYLPAASPWKAKYRSVNCSGVEYAL